VLLDDNEPGVALNGYGHGLIFVTRHFHNAIRSPDFLKNEVAHSVISLYDQDVRKWLSSMTTARH
jgi:hypothetical protein